MYKKLIAACMALAAFAGFVGGPATASAANNPILTEPTGTALAVGSKFTATQVGATTRFLSTAGSELFTCTTATMTGTITNNAVGNVQGNITSVLVGGTGAKAAGEPANECTGTSNFSFTAVGLPWCLSSTNLLLEDEFRIRGGECGKAETKPKLILATTTIGECEYEATGPLKGKIKTDGTNGETSDAILTVEPKQEASGFKKIRGSAFCASSFMLEMSFTLETDEATINPIYIS